MVYIYTAFVVLLHLSLSAILTILIYNAFYFG